MANILTFFRIFISLIIPVSFWFIFKYINNQEREIYILFILVLFIFASLSDFFDGFIARKYNQESLLGKVLDPIADKLLVIISLLVLMISYWENSLIFFSVILIIFREILISGLREVTASDGLELAVTKLSKWKTASQLIAIILLFFNIYSYGVGYEEIIFPKWIYLYSYSIANIVIIIATLLSIITAINYVSLTIKHIKKRKTN